MPKVAIKAGTPPFATNSPLIKPHTTPMPIATTSGTISGAAPGRPNLAEHTAARAITLPADKSSPPQIRVKVMPIATTDTVEVCLRMLIRFVTVRKDLFKMARSRKINTNTR